MELGRLDHVLRLLLADPTIEVFVRVRVGELETTGPAVPARDKPGPGWTRPSSPLVATHYTPLAPPAMFLTLFSLSHHPGLPFGISHGYVPRHATKVGTDGTKLPTLLTSPVEREAGKGVHRVLPCLRR